jgi:hypothetical protein
LKFANTIILGMNQSDFSLPEKLDILQHVRNRIVENFVATESAPSRSVPPNKPTPL